MPPEPGFAGGRLTIAETAKLCVEWPACERLKLENRVRRGLVGEPGGSPALPLRG
jgi:hypothetical protein